MALLETKENRHQFLYKAPPFANLTKVSSARNVFWGNIAAFYVFYRF